MVFQSYKKAGTEFGMLYTRVVRYVHYVGQLMIC